MILNPLLPQLVRQEQLNLVAEAARLAFLGYRGAPLARRLAAIEQRSGELREIVRLNTH